MHLATSRFRGPFGQTPAFAIRRAFRRGGTPCLFESGSVLQWALSALSSWMVIWRNLLVHLLGVLVTDLWTAVKDLPIAIELSSFDGRIARCLTLCADCRSTPMGALALEVRFRAIRGSRAPGEEAGRHTKRVRERRVRAAD